MTQDGEHGDTQFHGTTTRSTGSGQTHSETTIWVFRDPRKTKVSIYRGYEGLPWAMADLVRKTNLAIDRGEVPGTRLAVGDVVQACVVSYYDGEMHKPQTTDDSPRYATLPYRLVLGEGGSLSAEPAVPPETAIHFNIPVTVGEIIPTLDEDARHEVLVSLQLKEAAHTSGEAVVESVKDAVRSREASYEVTDQADSEATAFMTFIADEAQPEGTPAQTPAETPTEAPPPDPGAPSPAPDATRAESERIRRRISTRLQRRTEDRDDFGFSDG